VAAVAVLAFSERGERAGEVGGDGSDDDGTLLILWLLKGVLYGRMSSDVLIIETVGTVFILLNSLSQPRGSSMSRWVRDRGV